MLVRLRSLLLPGGYPPKVAQALPLIRLRIRCPLLGYCHQQSGRPRYPPRPPFQFKGYNDFGFPPLITLGSECTLLMGYLPQGQRP